MRSAARLQRSAAALQISALRCDYTVLAVDLRGHGASAATPLSSDGLALPPGDVASIVAAAAFVKPWVFAHSIGATVALLLEAAQPGAWKGMVLFEPMICGRPEQVGNSARRCRRLARIPPPPPTPSQQSHSLSLSPSHSSASALSHALLQTRQQRAQHPYACCTRSLGASGKVGVPRRVSHDATLCRLTRTGGWAKCWLPARGVGGSVSFREQTLPRASRPSRPSPHLHRARCAPIWSTARLRTRKVPVVRARGPRWLWTDAHASLAL